MSTAKAYLLLLAAVSVGAFLLLLRAGHPETAAALAGVIGGAVLLVFALNVLVRLSGLESRLRELEGDKAAAERSGRVLRGWPKRGAR